MTPEDDRGATPAGSPRALDCAAPSLRRAADPFAGTAQALRAVAHAINNAVGAVSAWVQLLEAQVGPDAGAAGTCRQILRSIAGVEDLSARLSLFGRSPELHTAPLPLADTVRTALDGAPLRLGAEGVEVADSTPPVLADPTFLASVLSVLFRSLSENHETAARHRVSVAPAEDGRVRLDIIEIGSPIPPASAPALLDPARAFALVTFRRALALATTARAALLHGGDLAVRWSEPETLVTTLLLPAWRQDAGQGSRRRQL